MNLKGKTAVRALLCVAVLACMAIIFFFSSQDATVSSSASGTVIEKVAPVFYPQFSTLPTTRKIAIVEKLQSSVRTTAHGIIYAVLGILTTSTLTAFEIPSHKSIFYALIFCAFYAVTDEIHQFFVPGRSMQLIDIIVDIVGSAIGAVLYITLFNIAVKLRQKKQTI